MPMFSAILANLSDAPDQEHAQSRTDLPTTRDNRARYAGLGYHTFRSRCTRSGLVAEEEKRLLLLWQQQQVV